MTLLPCKICGSPAKCLPCRSREDSSPGSEQGFRVLCDRARCTLGLWAPTEAEAVTRWNREFGKAPAGAAPCNGPGSLAFSSQTDATLGLWAPTEAEAGMRWNREFGKAPAGAAPEPAESAPGGLTREDYQEEIRLLTESRAALRQENARLMGQLASLTATLRDIITRLS